MLVLGRLCCHLRQCHAVGGEHVLPLGLATGVLQRRAKVEQPHRFAMAREFERELCNSGRQTAWCAGPKQRNRRHTSGGCVPCHNSMPFGSPVAKGRCSWGDSQAQQDKHSHKDMHPALDTQHGMTLGQAGGRGRCHATTRPTP